MANIKRNLAYNFVLSFSQLLLPLFSIPYISRILDPAGIGHVGFIDSFTFYFVIIAEFGITSYGIREVARCHGDKQKLAVLVPQLLTLHIVSSLVTLVFYGIGIALLWDKIADLRLLLFSASFFLVNFFACEWYFMGQEDFGFIAIRSIVVRLLGLASIFILIRRPADYYFYYWIIAGSSILTSLWNNVILFRQVKFSFRNVAWTQHLRYVWVTYAISLLYSIPLYLDNVLLGMVSTAAIVGIYSLSIKVVRIGSTILTDSFLVFFPRIVSLSNEEKFDQLQQKLTLNIQFIIILAVPMGVGLFLVADELAAVFFGAKFLAISDNVRVLSVYPLIKGVSLFLSNPILLAHNKERAYLKNLVCTSALFFVLALTLGSTFQSTGVCLAVVLTDLALVIANYVTVRRFFDYNVFDRRTILHAVFASACFIPAILTIRHFISADLARLVLSIIACMTIYGTMLVLLKNDFVTQVLRVVRGRNVIHQLPRR